MDNEILVHIKASARAIDDTRYRAIARNVIDFKPVNVTRVTGCFKRHVSTNQPQTVVTSTKDNTNESFSFATEQNGPPCPVPQRRFRKEPNRYAVVPNTAIKKQARYKVTKFLAVHQGSDRCRKSTNPPYKSPLRNSPAKHARIAGAPTTPSSSAATMLLETVLVPNTERQQLQKRIQPESTSFCPESPIVIDSESFHQSGLQQCGFLKRVAVSVKVPVAEGYNDASTSTSSQHRRLSMPGVTDNLATSGGSPYSPKGVLSTNRPSVVKHMMMEGEVGLKMGAASAVVVSRKGELVSAREHHESEPSRQPTSGLQVDSFVPETNVGGIHQVDLHREESLDPNNFPPTATDDLNYSLQALRSTPAFSELQALPLVLTAPDPIPKQVTNPTCNNPILRATAEGLSLPMRFRPETMTRHVYCRERGYWNVPITIITPEEAMSTRRQTSNKPENEEGPLLPPLLKHPSLTEEEFVAMWTELSRFVSSGNAGWSVRVVRRGFSIFYPDDQARHRAQLHLQVFCFGEAIPYIYAMLLVCSRMHIICKATHWVSTIDEKPIITMAVDQPRKEAKEEWRRFDDDHGRVFWGWE